MNALDFWKHSPLRNYIIPGLTSWLLIDPDSRGCVRLFEMTREQLMGVAPHSHRFDFTCIVLRGRVINTIWRKVPFNQCIGGDKFTMTELHYLGKPGEYEASIVSQCERFESTSNTYEVGDMYSMKASEIHSIHFARGSLVMFFEGPSIGNATTLLDPFEGGETIPQSDVQRWMFKS